jgi:hypothetical protein
MPRKVQDCARCGKREIAGDGLCARCLEIHLTPAMMLDQCPLCKEALLIGERCSCWRCRCGQLNLYGQPCSHCFRAQTVQ